MTRISKPILIVFTLLLIAVATLLLAVYVGENLIPERVESVAVPTPLAQDTISRPLYTAYYLPSNINNSEVYTSGSVYDNTQFPASRKFVYEQDRNTDARQNGWEIDGIFSDSISGDAVDQGYGYQTYGTSALTHGDTPATGTLRIHQASENLVTELYSPQTLALYPVSDILVEGDTIWFYYLQAADLTVETVSSGGQLALPVNHFLMNTPRMYQRRFSLTDLTVTDTEACLPDLVLGKPYSFNVNSPDRLYLFEWFEDGSKTMYTLYPGVCENSIEYYQADDLQVDPTAPLYQVPRPLISAAN